MLPGTAIEIAWYQYDMPTNLYIYSQVIFDKYAKLTYKKMTVIQYMVKKIGITMQENGARSLPHQLQTSAQNDQNGKT